MMGYDDGPGPIGLGRPAQGTAVRYGYDARGLPSGAELYRDGQWQQLANRRHNTAGMVQYTALLPGGIMSWFGSGIVIDGRRYDELGRMKEQRVVRLRGWQMTTVAGQMFGYGISDEALLIRTELAGTPTRTTTLDYDSRHQLTGASDDQGYEALLDYGPAGRLTAAYVAAPGAPNATARNATYVYTDADGGASISDPEAVSRLDGPGGVAVARFGYDAAGNVVRRWRAATGSAPEQTLTFGYDGDLNQREASSVGGGRELYYYAGGTQRTLVVSKSSSGATSRVKLRFGPLEIWYTPDGQTDKVWADVSLGGPIARIKDGRDVEVQANSQRGHLLVSLDANLDVNGGFQYGAFGEILAEVGDPSEHLRRFNDKEQDALTGLSYYGYRYYDPLSLTWTQSDPLFRFVPDLRLAEPRNANLYVFTLNNPVRFVDPDGRFVFTAASAAIGVCTATPGTCVRAAAALAMAAFVTKEVIKEKGKDLGQDIHNGINAAGAVVNAAVGAATSAIDIKALAAGLQAQQKDDQGTDQNGDTSDGTQQDDQGVKLTKGGSRAIGNLTDLKDTQAADAIRDRGGTASNVNEALGDSLKEKTVGEIANLAAQKDKAAVKALKIIKQAKKKGQRLD